MPIKYANASLDPQLVKDLKKIHKETLAPLGINYSHPAVIRYLVKYHKLASGVHAELAKETVAWEEDGDE